MESRNRSTKTANNCCRFLKNPVEIKNMKDQKKWRWIYMYINVAISCRHFDCIEPLLMLNADPNVLAVYVEMGKYICMKIGGFVLISSSLTYARNLLQIPLKFGLGPGDFIDCLPECIYLGNGVEIRPIEILMASHTPGSEAILRQEPYGTMSAETSRKLHQQALSQAVEKADLELVRRFIVAGTRKELLREEIQEKRTRKLIKKGQADKLHDIVNEN